MAESNGVYIAVNLTVDEAEKELAKLKRKIASFEVEKVKLSLEIEKNDSVMRELEAKKAEIEEEYKKFSDLESKYTSAETRYGNAKAALDAKNASFKDWGITPDDLSDESRARYDALVEEVQRAKEELQSLQEGWNAVSGHVAEVKDALAEVNGQIATAEREDEVLKQKVEEINNSIHDTEQIAEAFAQRVEEGKSASERLREGLKKAQEESKKFNKRIAGLVKRMLFFNIISQGLRKVREWLSSAGKSSKEFTAAMNELKGSFMTLITPIINWAIPKLTTLIQVLDAIVKQVGSLIFGMFGSTWDKAAEDAKDLSKSMEKTAGSAAKTKKSLAGIDEINKLDGNSGGGGSSGSKPTFNTGEITDKILQIEAIVAGAALALGAILCFSGVNVPLGIALMALGALTLVAEAKTNWNTMSEQVRKTLTRVITVVSGAALAVGAILALSGANIPLGLGLMLAGAAGLAAAVTVSWSLVETKTRQTLANITSVVSGFLIALGVLILLFAPSHIGWGIALIIAGGALGVSALTVNWNTMPNKTQATLKTIAGIVAGAMLVIGVLLVFLCPAAIGIGLALIAGSVGVAALAFSWDTIPKKVSETIGKVRKVLTTNSITDGVAELWEKVKKYWKNNIAPKFTKEFWKTKFDSIKEALKTKIKDGVNAAIATMNRFIDWINKKMRLSWGDFKILGQTVIKGGSFQLLTIPHIPELAQGTVVPPNREFLAMLGDNKNEPEVVSPLSTMKDALLEALNESGLGRQTVAVYVDGKELFDIVVGRNNAEVMRTGRTRLAT